ncbi:MAG: transposase [Accumulibacter sp.]|uniref:transposase n=1 Tax=Accumulibacter sp. TaxID=2053492 RepID=UPI002FC2B89E
MACSWRRCCIGIKPASLGKTQRFYDQHLYQARHLIENFFARLKQYRAITTRYDKTARNFLGAIHLVASVVTVKVASATHESPLPPRGGEGGVSRSTAPRRRSRPAMQRGPWKGPGGEGNGHDFHDRGCLEKS